MKQVKSYDQVNLKLQLRKLSKKDTRLLPKKSKASTNKFYALMTGMETVKEDWRVEDDEFVDFGLCQKKSSEKGNFDLLLY